MSYINAETVLPEDIIKLIQQYVDGEYLYIPRKSQNQKQWGEKSGIKVLLNARNEEITKLYALGASIAELEKLYYLSEKSIRRIIYKEKSKDD